MHESSMSPAMTHCTLRFATLLFAVLYTTTSTSHVHHVDARNALKWTRRQRGPSSSVSRMFSISHTAGEKYYLRLLLNVVRGPKCYEDVRTLDDGTVCSTFKEAARQRGLLADDQDNHRAMEEASQWQMAAQLRTLFATLLISNEVLDPQKLWRDHEAALCEDILHQARQVGRVASLPPVDLDGRVLSFTVVCRPLVTQRCHCLLTWLLWQSWRCRMNYLPVPTRCWLTLASLLCNGPPTCRGSSLN